MVRYFKWDIMVAVTGFLIAMLWAYFGHGSVMTAVFVVFFLAILEITLSFDNAIVNAMRLEKMTHKWQQRFLTWGILIAVFGMRLFFPLLMVSIFSDLHLWQVAMLAVTDVTQYTHYLELGHIQLLSFGGTFLMMLCFTYLMNPDKKILWITPIEKILRTLGKVPFLPVLVTTGALLMAWHFTHAKDPMSMLYSGLAGIGLFLLIDGISGWMEKRHFKKQRAAATKTVVKSGFVGFLYLELIDASFSLDGVLGAFAITMDIILITVGLAIGAMFVRSMTIVLVEKGSLKNFIYLEHGAHWAIGALSSIMLISTVHEVSEIVTGSIGLFFISLAFISSIRCNHRLPKEQDIHI